MGSKIMVIENERIIADVIAYALNKEGYTVEVVDRGDTAIQRINQFKPDAILLDVMLPGMDGYDILKKLQDKGSLGVIMLTAKEDLINKILGLELGADDYITKPFDIQELLARLKSLLRRMQAARVDQERTELTLRGVVLNVSQRTAIAGNQKLDLTPKEYDMLVLLLSHPNRVYSREQLLDLVWGLEYIGGTRTVDIHIQRLRKKLGIDHNEIIQTVHGIGYKALGD